MSAATEAGVKSEEVIDPLFAPPGEQEDQDARHLRLDKSSTFSKRRQLLATLLATLGSVVNGMAIGYTGTAAVSLTDPEGGENLYGEHFHLSMQQLSWTVSLLNLGAFFGCLVSKPLLDKLGRKNVMFLLVSLAYCMGFGLIIAAVNVSMIYAGRFFCGLGLGLYLSSVTVYITEIATVDTRGLLGSMVQTSGSLGIVLVFVAGIWFNWRQLAGLSAALTVVFASTGFCVAPESPRWFLQRGREFSAIRSFEWLRGRGGGVAEAELEATKRAMVREKREESSSVVALLPCWKAFLAASMLLFVYVASGLHVLLAYATDILTSVKGSIDFARTGALIIGVCQLISCPLAVLVVSRAPRKPLLVISTFLVAGCQGTLGWCLRREEFTSNPEVDSIQPAQTEPTAVEEEYSFSPVLALVAACLSVVAGNAGFGTLAWVCAAELMPTRVRAVANAVLVCGVHLAVFLVAKTYADLSLHGRDNAFFTYAAYCAMGGAIALVIPETRLKTPEQIEEEIPPTSWKKSALPRRA